MMPFISHVYLNYLGEAERAKLLASHVALGYHPETRDEFLLSENDRYAGTYVLGVQGVGKSALLENMIAHDVQVGNAVVVIDPHGDLTAHCLAQLPASRASQAYLLDMEDETYPFGVNVFAAAGTLVTDVQRTQAIDRIMHIFEVLWPEVLGQQNLPRYVRAAIIVFLENPGMTLVDMHTFLTDDDFRAQLLTKVKDPTVKRFWQTQYNNQPEHEKTRRVQPLITRLEGLFMGRSLVRNIVGQRQNSVNFRKAMEERQALFIKLPVKTLGKDAELVGVFLMAQLSAAIFSFADTSESQRPGVSLYADEVQHFTTQDFSPLFTEARKFGARVTIAHQYRNQLPAYLQDSTLTARTRICFQTTPDDGREMAHVFPTQSEGIRPEDMTVHPAEHLLTHGSDGPCVQQFIEWYLRPLQAQKRGNRVEITNEGFSMIGLVGDVVSGPRQDHIRVADPTSYLDHLLYQVMHSHNPTLEIPWELVRGFANCGRGFFQQARGMTDEQRSYHIQYPPALVIETSMGPYWTRPPEGGMEQMYHFLFHLRQTMSYLAEHPIGKESTPSTTAVGQMLSHLPRRAAFVRSGDDVGVIYTHDTPQRMMGTDFGNRLRLIQQQTRVVYCHPREQIEQQLMEELERTESTGHPEVTKMAATPQTMPDAVDEELRQQEDVTAPESQQTLPSRWEEVDGD